MEQTLEFWITPDKKEELNKAVTRMSKHLTEKPVIKIGEVEHKIVKNTYKCDGELFCEKYGIDVCWVTIEQMQVSNWVLVAGVSYDENLMTMCSQKYYKMIPAQYGLNYMRCDYCGGHRERKQSYIVYNTETQEWKQVGSTCINKMVSGYRYLAKFMESLCQYLGTIGCTGDEEHFCGWAVKSKRAYKVYPIAEMLDCVVKYQQEKEENKVWVKAIYEGSKKVNSGTNDWLMEAMAKGGYKADNELFAKVWEVVKQNKGGYDWDETERDFNGKIYDAFEAEYAPMADMWLVWFGLKKYTDSLEKPYDEIAKEAGYVKGEKVTIIATLVGIERYDDYYTGGFTFEAKLIDNNGIQFRKTIAHRGVFEPYQQEDGTYKFQSEIKYIAMKGKYVGLGGRLSKAK